MHRNHPDQRGRGGYNRPPPYDGQFSGRERDSNGRHWRDSNRDDGSHYGRRDQFLPKDNYNRIHYAGVREHSDAPAPKYTRHTNDTQSRHWFAISQFSVHLFFVTGSHYFQQHNVLCMVFLEYHCSVSGWQDLSKCVKLYWKLLINLLQIRHNSDVHTIFNIVMYCLVFTLQSVKAEKFNVLIIILLSLSASDNLTGDFPHYH